MYTANSTYEETYTALERVLDKTGTKNEQATMCELVEVAFEPSVKAEM